MLRQLVRRLIAGAAVLGLLAGPGPAGLGQLPPPGGTDGGGVDILPDDKDEQTYRDNVWLFDFPTRWWNRIDMPGQWDMVPRPPGRSTGGGGGDIEIRSRVRAGNVDLTIDPGRSNGTGAVPVQITGTIGGVYVHGTGILVNNGSESRLYGPDGEPGCWVHPWDEDQLGGWVLHVGFDEDELGDGDPFDDVCGSIEDYGGGFPRGKGVVTY